VRLIEQARPRLREGLDTLKLEGAGRGALGDVCLVYGNCQAEPLRQMLAASPSFSERFRTVRVPSAHTVTAEQRDRLARAMSRATLVVAQPVKDGYKGLGLGTRELTAGGRGRTVLVPVLYYEGNLPYLMLVHQPDGTSFPGPIKGTNYHDLRAMVAAADGIRPEDLAGWLSVREPSGGAVRATAEQSRHRLRERQAVCDVAADDLLVDPLGTFWTVNHPSWHVLHAVCERIHATVGLPAPQRPSAPAPEPLGELRVGVDPPVAEALGILARPWTIYGTEHATTDVLADHLAWYAARPEIAAAGVAEHAERARLLGLVRY
jgi:Polysaccharide biosynthesis enzyme WcbI